MAQITKIKNAIERIRPDKVQLNTAVRPTADADIKRLDAKRLQAIAIQIGPRCEVVADFSPHQYSKSNQNKAEDVLSMLKRRPCTLNDICSSLNIAHNEALKYISHFQQQGLIDSEQKDGTIFFIAN